MLDCFHVFPNTRPAQEPFILATGELYRDVLTVRTASLAASFAKRFQLRLRSQAGRLRRLGRGERTPNFAETEIARRGRITPDEEIFDFTDSRFLNPPRENVRNHPEVNLIELRGVVTPAPPISYTQPRFQPLARPSPAPAPRPRPTPQPIFQLPDNFVNDISQLPVPQSHSLSPEIQSLPPLRQIYRHTNTHITSLRPLNRGQFYPKVNISTSTKTTFLNISRVSPGVVGGQLKSRSFS